MARKFVSLRLLPLLLLLLTASGCGYYNPNMLPDEELGPQVRLYVPVWPNSTNELNLETNIRNAISDWLMQSKRIILVGSQAEADYLLSGSVVSVSYPGLSYDATDTAKTLKAVLTVSYTIKELASGRTIWQMSSYSLEETYNLGASNAQTDSNKRQALQTLADKLGEQLYIRLFRVLMKQQRRGGAAKTAPATPTTPTVAPTPLPSR